MQTHTTKVYHHQTHNWFTVVTNWYSTQKTIPIHNTTFTHPQVTHFYVLCQTQTLLSFLLYSSPKRNTCMNNIAQGKSVLKSKSSTA
jgi:hypothetical protein